MVWTTMGLLAALHCHVYYGVGWTMSLWWSLKDWYLWGALAPVIASLARRVPFSSDRWLRPLVVHGLGGLGAVLTHALASVWLSSLVEGLQQPFSYAVQSLFLKKLVLSALVYAAIVAVAHRRSSIGVPAAAKDGARAIREPEPASPRADRILVKKGQLQRFLSVKQIDRIEACGNYVRIFAGSETYFERRTLSSLEAQLGTARFLRIHRSHLVNIERVRRIEPSATGGHQVVLEDGLRLTLSRKFRKQLERRVGRSF